MLAAIQGTENTLWNMLDSVRFLANLIASSKWIWFGNSIKESCYSIFLNVYEVVLQHVLNRNKIKDLSRYVYNIISFC